MKAQITTQKQNQKFEKQEKQRRRFKEQEKQKKEFIKGQNSCYLCGESISTYLERSSKSYSIIEKAQCQNCMTLIRVKNHSLQ